MEKANAIKDDARTLVITGLAAANDPIPFNVEIYPACLQMRILIQLIFCCPFILS
jgi:hypothetical protein